MKYAYKTISVAPTGLRVSGDDHTQKLSELLEEESNELGEKGWEMVAVVPSLASGGSVSKVMAIFKRSKETEDQ